MIFIAIIFGLIGIYALKAGITGNSFLFGEYKEKNIFIAGNIGEVVVNYIENLMSKYRNFARVVFVLSGILLLILSYGYSMTYYEKNYSKYSKLVAKNWFLTSKKEFCDNNVIDLFIEIDDCAKDNAYVFNDDNTGKIVVNSECNKNSDDELFSWSFNSDKTKINMNIQNTQNDMEIIEFMENKLILKEYYENDCYILYEFSTNK